MLTRKRRVTTKLFQKTLKNGRSFDSTNVYLKTTKTPGTSKITFSIPKSVEKSAVKRNKLKRKGVFLLEDVEKNLKDGFVGVFFLKKTGVFPDSKEINELLIKAGFIDKNTQQE